MLVMGVGKKIVVELSFVVFLLFISLFELSMLELVIEKEEGEYIDFCVVDDEFVEVILVGIWVIILDLK